MRIDVIDHPDADHPARPAATLVLVRDADGGDDRGAAGIEVLMIRRGADTAFGGMWAFPGGVVEDGDIPPGTEPDPLPAARVAAVRETREETDLVVDPDSLVWWSHWLPPGKQALSVKRFSTWFFVAPGDDEHADHRVGVDGDEVSAHLWIATTEALAMQARGEIQIAPPTFVTLTQLARHRDVASAMASAEPEFFATQIAFEGDTRICIWHGDVAYGASHVDHRAAGPRHRLAMSDGTWTYDRTAP